LQDVEDQATAGLDLRMPEALARLGNTTGLLQTQVSGEYGSYAASSLAALLHVTGSGRKQHMQLSCCRHFGQKLGIPA
jgi:hypothetical protein